MEGVGVYPQARHWTFETKMAACSAKHLIWTILRKNRGLWTVWTILLDLIWLINLFVCLFFFKRRVYLRSKVMDLNVSTCSLKDYPLTNYDTWSNFETTEIGLYFAFRTKMMENKRTKTMKQYQVDFSLNRKQRSLLS